MDRNALAMLIPIMALAIPVAAVVFGGLIKLQKMKLEEARARMGVGQGDLSGELDALAQEVQEIRGELAELHERVDFTERLLARGDATR